MQSKINTAMTSNWNLRFAVTAMYFTNHLGAVDVTSAKNANADIMLRRNSFLQVKACEMNLPSSKVSSTPSARLHVHRLASHCGCQASSTPASWRKRRKQSLLIAVGYSSRERQRFAAFLAKTGNDQVRLSWETIQLNSNKRWQGLRGLLLR